MMRKNDRMRKSEKTSPNAPPLEIRGHHLLCAVCKKGGMKTPPEGADEIDRLLKAIWEYPFTSIKVTADVDVIRAHYRDAYEGRGSDSLPEDFEERRKQYVLRKKDLEVCRALGIIPNTVMPAYTIYTTLFERQPTLDGICRSDVEESKAWPKCPYAEKGYYEKIASEPRVGFREQMKRGEELDGKGIFAMIRTRTKDDLWGAKEKSAEYILKKAEVLYIRPHHLLCIICRPCKDKILIEDNLIELLFKMRDNPDIPVTLTEGCCMVCDSCNVYHPEENVCYHSFFKDSLRDLLVLERLGLEPGATLSAGRLYQLIYDRIGSMKEICDGRRDNSTLDHIWGACNYDTPHLENARNNGMITGNNPRFK